MYIPAVFEAPVLEEALGLGNTGVGRVGLEIGGWYGTGTGGWVID